MNKSNNVFLINPPNNYIAPRKEERKENTPQTGGVL